jgi:hypothetical protein
MVRFRHFGQAEPMAAFTADRAITLAFSRSVMPAFE